MGFSLRRAMQEDLERTDRLIEECKAELEAAEAVAQGKKKTIGEAESYRERLKAFLESDVSEFWSKYGVSEVGLPTASQRPVPTLKTIFEGLQNAKRHLDRMRVYAMGNSGRVFAKEAAELLISLGLSNSQNARGLAKNLGTAMSASKEFIKQPDGSFVLIEFFATQTKEATEQVVERDSCSRDDSQLEDLTALVCEDDAAFSQGSQL